MENYVTYQKVSLFKFLSFLENKKKMTLYLIGRSRLIWFTHDSLIFIIFAFFATTISQQGVNFERDIFIIYLNLKKTN